MKTLALLICVLVIAIATPAIAENPAPDPSLCGPYPTNFQEIVKKWLDTQLIDAGSARIEWDGAPTPADLGQGDKHMYGYVVYFRVNARNQFGAYTGMQKHGVLINDNKVIKGLGFGYQ